MRHFGIKIQKFSGEGAAPSPNPSPLGRGIPLPKPYPSAPAFTNPGSALANISCQFPLNLINPELSLSIPKIFLVSAETINSCKLFHISITRTARKYNSAGLNDILYNNQSKLYSPDMQSYCHGLHHCCTIILEIVIFYCYVSSCLVFRLKYTGCIRKYITCSKDIHPYSHFSLCSV